MFMRFGRATRWIWRYGAVAMCVLGTAGIARADVISLGSGNSAVTIDTTDGMTNWTVDGIDRLTNQWFSYRFSDGFSDYTGSLDTLGLTSQSAGINGSGDPFATLVYGGNSLLKADLTFTLTGGAVGSKESTITETVQLTNQTSTKDWDFYSPLTLYQYSDFDMCGSGAPSSSFDSISMNQNLASQGGVCDNIVATVSVNPAAGDQAAPFNVPPPGPAYLADNAGTVATYIADGLDLPNSGSFNGTTGDNPAFAFQWNFALSPGETTSPLTITKSLAPVPEPMSLMLLGVGLVGVGRVARRRAKRAV